MPAWRATRCIPIESNVSINKKTRRKTPYMALQELPHIKITANEMVNN